MASGPVIKIDGRRFETIAALSERFQISDRRVWNIIKAYEVDHREINGMRGHVVCAKGFEEARSRLRDYKKCAK
jgi:hypothetical protein